VEVEVEVEVEEVGRRGNDGMLGCHMNLQRRSTDACVEVGERRKPFIICVSQIAWRPGKQPPHSAFPPSFVRHVSFVSLLHTSDVLAEEFRCAAT
jgi:hypothetical protein